MKNHNHAAGTGISILLGYFSIAVAFGVSARTVGFGALPTAAMSVFVFAGASQFVAIGLIAQGAPALAIIAATFVLNSRHIVMSMALRDRISGESVPRALLGFGITDEVFAATATQPGSISDRDLLLTEALAYSGWIGGTIAGFLAGAVLPAIVEQAMGIALYAMFIALLVPAVIRFPRYLVPAAAAGGLNWMLQWAGISAGAALLLAIAATASLFAVSPDWTESSAE